MAAEPVHTLVLWTWALPQAVIRIGRGLTPDLDDHDTLVIGTETTESLGPDALAALAAVGIDPEPVFDNALKGGLADGVAVVATPQNRPILVVLTSDDVAVLEARLARPFGQMSPRALFVCPLGPSASTMAAALAAAAPQLWDEPSFAGPIRITASLPIELDGSSTDPRAAITERLGSPVDEPLLRALAHARGVAGVHQQRRKGDGQVSTTSLLIGLNLASEQVAAFTERHAPGWSDLVMGYTNVRVDRLRELLAEAPATTPRRWTDNAVRVWNAAIGRVDTQDAGELDLLRALLVNPGHVHARLGWKPRQVLTELEGQADDAERGGTPAPIVGLVDTWEKAALQLTLGGTVDPSGFDTLVAEVSDGDWASAAAADRLAWTGVDPEALLQHARTTMKDEPVWIELDDDSPSVILIPPWPGAKRDLDLSEALVGADATRIAIHTPRTAATLGAERFFAAVDRSLQSLIQKKRPQSRVVVRLSDPERQLLPLARKRFGPPTSPEVGGALLAARGFAATRGQVLEGAPTIVEADVLVGLAMASSGVRDRILRVLEPDAWDDWAREQTGFDGPGELPPGSSVDDADTVWRWSEDLRNSWTLAEALALEAERLGDDHLLRAVLRPPDRQNNVLGWDAATVDRVLDDTAPSQSLEQGVPPAAPSADQDPQEEPMRDEAPSQITLRVGPGHVEIPELSLQREPPDWSSGFGPGAADPLDAIRPRLHTLQTAQARQLGQQLAVALFGDDRAQVEDALRTRPGSLLRVVLDLEGDAWRLPLEYLATDDRFWFERGCAFVRHQKAQDAVPQSLTLPERPERILMATANPEGRQEFDAATHQAILEDGRKALNTSIVPLSPATPSALRDQLPSVEALHFLGHGGPGHLVLVNDDGSAANTPVEDLAKWLLQPSENGSTKRFVVLGACDSATEAEAAPSVAREIVKRTGLPTLAMQAKVPQEFSSRFVSAFYANLKNADDAYEIEQAVYRARQVDGGAAAGIPVLVADTSVADARPRYDGKPVQVVLERWIHDHPARSVAAANTLPDEAHPSLHAALAARAHTHPGEPLPLEPGALTERLGELEPEAVHPRGPRVGNAHAATTITAHHDPPLADGWDASGLEKLRENLSFPPTLIPTVVAELRAGRHVLLVGPVGTGKTSLARGIVEALGYTPHVVTASADWTPFEVVGGFWPHAVRDGDRTHVDFGFRQGAFLDAVMPNWTENAGGGWRRAHAATRGVWLVLDELNRADMDRALGGLFTALETRRLRIPTVSDEPGTPSTTEIPIPRDFRVVATINAADRHYLFRLSDALKRRFAFVDVPVTPDWVDEWTKLSARLDGWRDEEGLFDDLRRFVYLARQLHPIGSAQLLAAGRFLVASRRDPGQPVDLQLDDAQRLAQALRGSLLPTLEELEPRIVSLLQAWCRGVAPADLERHLQDLVPLPGRADRFRTALGGVAADSLAELARRRHVAGPLDLDDVFARLIPDA